MSNEAKKYTIAGTSDYKGSRTWRFSAGALKVREGVLKRGGHARIKLVELPNAMTKEEAIAYCESTHNMKAKLPANGRQGGKKDAKKDKATSGAAAEATETTEATPAAETPAEAAAPETVQEEPSAEPVVA